MAGAMARRKHWWLIAAALVVLSAAASAQDEAAVVYMQPNNEAAGSLRAQESTRKRRMSAEGARAVALGLLGEPAHPDTDAHASAEADEVLQPSALLQLPPVVHVTLRGIGAGDLPLPDGAIEKLLDGEAQNVEQVVAKAADSKSGSSGATVTDLGCDSSNLPTKAQVEAVLAFDTEAVKLLEGKADGFLMELACLAQSSSSDSSHSPTEMASFIRAEINGLDSVREQLSSEELEAAQRLLRLSVERVLENVRSSKGQTPVGHVLAPGRQSGVAAAAAPQAPSRRTILVFEESLNDGNTTRNGTVAEPEEFQTKTVAYSIGLTLLSAIVASVYCLFTMTNNYDSLILQSRIPETKLE